MLHNLCLHFSRQDGRNGKNRKENHATKITKIPKTKRRKFRMNETLERLYLLVEQHSKNWKSMQPTNRFSYFWQLFQLRGAKQWRRICPKICKWECWNWETAQICCQICKNGMPHLQPPNKQLLPNQFHQASSKRSP